MNNIQVHFDKLRYYWGFGSSARDSLISQAAADNFNTVSIPIQWYEVEPSKDVFDWTILDEYLGLSKKYNLKLELLWFAANSGGQVQWLGNTGVDPVHLRTPDYVLYSLSPGASSTTGVTSASQVYFNNDNTWLSQGNVSLSNTSITLDAGQTVRITRQDNGFVTGKRRQAEFASTGGGVTIESGYLGFAGNGHVNFNSRGGYIQWNNVDGLNGGSRAIRFRYVLTGTPSQTRMMKLTKVRINRSGWTKHR